MWWWFALIWLYVLGFVGLRAMAQDLNEGPLSWSHIRRLAFWPFVVFAAWIGDVADWFIEKLVRA